MIDFLEYSSVNGDALSSAHYEYDEESRINRIFYTQDYLYNSAEYTDTEYYLSYLYNKTGSIQSYEITSDDAVYTVTPVYDGHERVTSKNTVFRTDDYTVTGTRYYQYKSLSDNTSTVVSGYATQLGSESTKGFLFTYDSANANITQIKSTAGLILNQYHYDSLDRLVREDNRTAQRTYVYNYDSDGNIRERYVYGFTTASGSPTTTLYSRDMYIYGNGDWGDQLTNYNGYSLTYDVMGNPTSYYNGSRMNMSWGHSGVLKALTFGSTTVGYTYNDGGVRTSKTVNGVLHSYSLDGEVIMSESFADKLLIYLYDEFGTPFGIKYRESDYALGEFDCYIFEKNLHGDIIGIFSEAGARVASYEYDAWGNCVNMTYASGYGVICNLNPFRYRSYYYDTETGFYYCGSRYYDPSLGRFISADSVGTVTLTPMSYTDKNLYAYCDNNPVMRTDNGGEFWDTFFDVVSLCASVIDVVKNPDDPMAWFGVIGDAVDLIPFVSGVGEVTRFVNTGQDAIKAADNLSDAGKAIDKLDDAAEAIDNIGSTKKLHRPYIRKSTRDAVEAAAMRTPDGKFIDACTGEVIPGKYDLGHTYGHEFWRERDMAMAKGWTQKQFNDYMNNPEFYRIEDPSVNRSHRFEMPRILN